MSGNNPLALDKEIKSGDNYIRRLQNITPIEVTGLYFFLSKLASGGRGYELFFGLCILVLIALMYFAYLPKI